MAIRAPIAQLETYAAAKRAQYPVQIFSGIQPTGRLHIGNYLCAVRQWVLLQHDTTQLSSSMASIQQSSHMKISKELQKDSIEIQQSIYNGVRKPIFCIVDLHAITVKQDRTKLAHQCIDMAASLLACGIDPDRSTLYIQSHVPQHTELNWMLMASMPMSWLNTMTQFKEKASKKETDSISLGLYAYPVLQAADILLYKGTHVPVGEDQQQHLELSRDIARRFNDNAGEYIFPEPQVMLTRNYARVMSLRDGEQKMSKSDRSELSRINLDDSDDEIRKKISKAKTDAEASLIYNVETHPDVTNLVNIFSTVSGRDITQIIHDEQYIGNKQTFKRDLAEALVEMIKPIRERKQQLLKDEDYIMSILRRGADECSTIAEETIAQTRHGIGLLARRGSLGAEARTN